MTAYDQANWLLVPRYLQRERERIIFRSRVSRDREARNRIQLVISRDLEDFINNFKHFSTDLFPLYYYLEVGEKFDREIRLRGGGKRLDAESCVRWSGVLSSRVLPCSNSRGGGERGARREMFTLAATLRESTPGRGCSCSRSPPSPMGMKKGREKRAHRRVVAGHHGFHTGPFQGGGWSGCRDFSYAFASQRFPASNEPVKMNNCFSSFFFVSNFLPFLLNVVLLNSLLNFLISILYIFRKNRF